MFTSGKYQVLTARETKINLINEIRSKNDEFLEAEFTNVFWLPNLEKNLTFIMKMDIKMDLQNH